MKPDIARVRTVRFRVPFKQTFQLIKQILTNFLILQHANSEQPAPEARHNFNLHCFYQYFTVIMLMLRKTVPRMLSVIL